MQIQLPSILQNQWIFYHIIYCALVQLEEHHYRSCLFWSRVWPYVTNKQYYAFLFWEAVWDKEITKEHHWRATTNRAFSARVVHFLYSFHLFRFWSYCSFLSERFVCNFLFSALISVVLSILYLVLQSGLLFFTARFFLVFV